MHFLCSATGSSRYPKQRLPTQPNGFLQTWLKFTAAPLQESSSCPTSTIRDSNCSTDSGSLFCTVALIICFFIMLYLCNARWCLCNTPFSCLSHRSFVGKAKKTGAWWKLRDSKHTSQVPREHKHTVMLYVISVPHICVVFFSKRVRKKKNTGN